LIEERQEAIAGKATDEMKDLAIIGAAQRVEHYEIAAYGTARTFAERLGNLF
jgi:ferritin-like metal-binding protein YciE